MPAPPDIIAAMQLELMACQIFLDAVLDAAFLEIAVAGVRVARRHCAGARTLTELLGFTGFAGTPLEADDVRARTVSMRVDLWIVELIEELVESRKPSRVRAFVREAVLAYVDDMAARQGAA
jgi:hypothetical protein